MNILAPQFLTGNITILAFILAAVVLVLGSDFFNRYVVFPFADGIKEKTYHSLKGRRSRRGERRTFAAELCASFLSTAIFIAYCYFGSYVLAEYIFGPILFKLKEIILFIVIGLFLLISRLINDSYLRRLFLKV